MNFNSEILFPFCFFNTHVIVVIILFVSLAVYSQVTIVLCNMSVFISSGLTFSVMDRARASSPPFTFFVIEKLIIYPMGYR